MYDKNEDWDKEQIYLETRVPVDHSMKSVVWGHLGLDFMSEQEKKQHFLRGFILIFFVMAFLFLYCWTQPPLFSEYKGETGTYKVNGLMKKITYPTGEKVKYTAQSMNGVVHFVVGEKESGSKYGEDYFAFNTHYGAKGVNMGTFPSFGPVELDVFHALMRVTKDYAFVRGNEYTYTGSSRSIMLGGSISGVFSLVYIPPVLLGLFLTFFPCHVADIGTFFFLYWEKFFHDDKFEQECRYFGMAWTGFWILCWFVFQF